MQACQGHQHGHDQAEVGQRNQAVQRHRGDVAGTRGLIEGDQHRAQPGQRRRAPRVLAQLECGGVIQIQQTPRRTLGYQHARAERRNEGGAEGGRLQAVGHHLQARRDRIDRIERCHQHHHGIAGQQRTDQQQPHGQAGSPQATVRRTLGRRKAPPQTAQPQPQREHHHQRGQQAQQRRAPAIGPDTSNKRIAPLLGQRRNACDIDRQALGHLAPQRRRQRRGDLLPHVFGALRSALLVDVGCQLLGTHGTGLGLRYRRGQAVALFGDGASLRGQFRRFGGAFRRRAQLRQLFADPIQLRLQRLLQRFGIAPGLRGILGQHRQCLDGLCIAPLALDLLQPGIDVRQLLLRRGVLILGQHRCGQQEGSAQQQGQPRPPCTDRSQERRHASHTVSRGPPRLRATIRHRR